MERVIVGVVFNEFLSVWDGRFIEVYRVIFSGKFQDVSVADGVNGVLFTELEADGVNSADDCVRRTVTKFGEVVDCDTEVKVRVFAVGDLFFLDHSEVVVGDIDGPEEIDRFIDECIAVEDEDAVEVLEKVAEGGPQEYHVCPFGVKVWSGRIKVGLVADVHGRDARRDRFGELVVFDEEYDFVGTVVTE